MQLNPARVSYAAADRALIGRGHAAAARPYVALHPRHAATPLLPLASLARELDVGAIHLKAEGGRMGLGSFKPLGGLHAVARLIQAHAARRLGLPVLPTELRSSAVRSIADGLTFVCASAGNHGLAVAAAARLFGATAVVFISETVPESFVERLGRQGARVVRMGADYEASMAEAAAAADHNGWILVADSSWPGYTDIPLDIMRGYTLLLDEAADALDRMAGPASHVFVQVGVGGLAAAAAGYLRDRWGDGFTFIAVEPAGAPCLLESARVGHPVRVAGAPTTLGRLDCKEPSLVAFELLTRLADGFMIISDAEAAAAACRLTETGAPVSACGAAGAAGLIALAGDASLRRAIGLDAGARVLLIGSEAPAAPTP